MKVTWADVNHTETPGSFRLFNGVVEIKHQQITIWKSKPTARFTVIPFKALADGVQRYFLGAYDVPGEDF
jgi:hypothetical protein